MIPFADPETRLAHARSEAERRIRDPRRLLLLHRLARTESVRR